MLPVAHNPCRMLSAGLLYDAFVSNLIKLYSLKIISQIHLVVKWPGLFYNTSWQLSCLFFPDDIFKCIFFNENVSILIRISLTFVPKAPINNIPALVQIIAWCRPGDKPFSEPIMVTLVMHICVTRPQWVKLLVMRRAGDKPSAEPAITFFIVVSI